MKKWLEGFVGRHWILKQINDHVTNPDMKSGYITLRSSAGIGKTTVLAKYIEENNIDVYHFNIGTIGINTTEVFLRNICSRLINKYKLPYTELPQG